MPAELQGLAKAQMRFKAFPPEVAAQVGQALDKGAAEIRDRAKAIAPRDTGELAGAIEVRDTLEGFGAGGAVGAFARMVSGQAGSLTRFIGVFPAKAGDAGWYAAFVEFGTASRQAGQRYTQGSGRRVRAKDTHPGTPPRPFLMPAFFSLRRRMLGRVNRAVNAAARKVASGG